ncbi:MAG: hypothetical protein P9X26_08885, partial [Candidatus Stygibacter frigidus]|nr:hypothetical protein [Candidatus Stygibacter frigidus]
NRVMTLDDLVEIGKLGNSNRATEGFLRFQPNWNFHTYFLDIKDIFLVFTDHRVRYVTIEDIRQNKFFWIKIKESDVIDEVIDSQSVQYCLPKSLIKSSQYQNDDDFLTGMNVVVDDNVIGLVTESFYNGAHNTLIVNTTDQKEIMIPVVDRYIISIDKSSHLITATNIRELIDL